MKLSTTNFSILIGPVQAGGKVTVFENGTTAATFYIATDSFKGSMDGGVKRVTEYHQISVKSSVFDDLYDLILEGNIVHVQGQHVSYQYKNAKFWQLQADKVSLLRSVKEK